MDYDDEYDDEDEQETQVETPDDKADRVDESLTFNVDVSYNLTPVIRAAVEKLVAKAVEENIAKAVDEAVKLGIEKEVGKIVRQGLKTPIKRYDYSGRVTEETSINEIIGVELDKIHKMGLKYELEYKDGYSTKKGTISAIIKHDIYTMVKEKLSPQFSEIEADFKAKSQAALREFAVAAVDSATQRTLGRLS